MTSGTQKVSKVRATVDTGKPVQATISVPTQGDLVVIDMAASLAQKNRSVYVSEKAIAAASEDLKARGIDPDSIRRAA